MKFARECLCVSPLVFQDNNCDITYRYMASTKKRTKNVSCFPIFIIFALGTSSIVLARTFKKKGRTYKKTLTAFVLGLSNFTTLNNPK